MSIIFKASQGFSMEAGDTLRIDTEALTAKINGDNAADKIQSGAVFFALQPGENNIEVAGSAGEKISFKITYKDRWV